MLIAGFRKTSFVDYPGKVASVVFTPHCNMRCTYCHNREIIAGAAADIGEEPVLEYLEKRRGLLDAVVISGGEPLLQQDLEGFIDRVRAMGYLIKLDTNGSFPEKLLSLIKGGKLDYVAMDVKAPFEKYDIVTQTKNDIDAIRKSLSVLRHSGVEYELRTTFAPQLTVEDIAVIAREIEGTKRYFLQQYRQVEEGDADPHLPAELEAAAQAAREMLGFCDVRGLMQGDI